MPTLFRFLTFIAAMVVLFYAAIFALVWYVKPKEGEITVRIPVEKVNPKPAPDSGAAPAKPAGDQAGQ